jgi:cytochrome b6-f complex iron-sulfur subunit
MNEQSRMPLESSPRFAPPPTRRDVLGLAAIWTSVVAFGGALLGALRLPMPSVFPESSAQVKIGPPEAFAIGSSTHLTEQRLWVIRDEQGLYAISSVCTHLGCIAPRDGETGRFKCPCHGSVFEADGSVVAGPAPSGLHWKAMTVAPDGQIVVDQRLNVEAGTRLTV